MMEKVIWCLIKVIVDERMDVKVMEFTVGDSVRFGFGFANPNHAAAVICAVAPFLWGWWIGKVERGGGRWRFAVPFVLNAALCVMLAMTFSRTGLVVLALEAAAWWRRRWREKVPSSLRYAAVKEVDSGGFASCCCRGDGAGSRLRDATPCQGIPHPRSKHSIIRLFRLFDYFPIRLFSYSVILSILVIWMWPRMTIDGAILNRPKIWLAGLQLFAANPFGVGFGNSGLVASAFLLPDGVEVRTLVNSHLTMLVDGGLFIGGAWLAFVAAALLSRATMPRTRIAFAGLALSSCSASVFDWHVLFGLDVAPDFGPLNLTLSWLLFSAFVSMGIVLIVRGFSWRRVVFAAGGVAAVGVIVAVACGRSGKDSASPVVAERFVTWGDGPVVYHDAEWGLKALKEHFPQGARIRIESGVEAVEKGGPDVWLFGEVAESAEKFCDRKVTVVAPPDYYEPPANVVEVKSL